MTTSVLSQGQRSQAHRHYFSPSFHNPCGISSHQHCCASEGLRVSPSDAGQGACARRGGLPSWSLERGKETPHTLSARQQHTTAAIGHANLISPEAHAHSELTNFQTCSIKTPTLSWLQFLQNDILPAVNLWSCRLALYIRQNCQKGKLDWGKELALSV